MKITKSLQLILIERALKLDFVQIILFAMAINDSYHHRFYFWPWYQQCFQIISSFEFKYWLCTMIIQSQTLLCIPFTDFSWMRWHRDWPLAMLASISRWSFTSLSILPFLAVIPAAVSFNLEFNSRLGTATYRFCRLIKHVEA